VAGAAAVLHQHHQQPITALHQADGLQLCEGLLRAGDQAHQPGEVGQAPGQLLQQVIQCCPAQAQACEFPLQVLHSHPRFRQQVVHITAVAQGAGNAAR